MFLDPANYHLRGIAGCLGATVLQLSASLGSCWGTTYFHFAGGKDWELQRYESMSK
jgi:hypothetical protein